MIFMRYESFRQYIRFYPVTTFLLTANIAMFIVVAMNGGSTGPNLYRFGAMFTVPPEPGAEIWRWFTSMFLHGGFDHLLFNCFALFVFAPPLERLLGHWRYAVLYVASGLIGAAFSAYLSSEISLSVGASGAIYGIYGAFLAIIVLRRWMLDRSSAQTVQIILAMGFVYSFLMANINWLAHLGGLVGGFLVYLVVDSARRHSSR